MCEIFIYIWKHLLVANVAVSFSARPRFHPSVPHLVSGDVTLDFLLRDGREHRRLVETEWMRNGMIKLATFHRVNTRDQIRKRTRRTCPLAFRVGDKRSHLFCMGSKLYLD